MPILLISAGFVVIVGIGYRYFWQSPPRGRTLPISVPYSQPPSPTQDPTGGSQVSTVPMRTEAPSSPGREQSVPVPITSGRWAGYTEITKNVKGTSYRLIIADTPRKQSRGLMDVTDLGEYDGMIFLFPNRETRTFWNMNTLMQLDLLWMDGEEIIGRSVLPSITDSKEVVTVSSPGPVDAVIELSASGRL
ncbi:MAG: DUF192 domain-containing protein [Patescibacteria group bacterium]|nr:DUF192 domain-containing protein [Patescibacteria group bacterium]